VVKYKFIRMPDSTGFGDYTESGQVILRPHVMADVARLPVLEIDSALHCVADLALGPGEVVFDYLNPQSVS